MRWLITAGRIPYLIGLFIMTAFFAGHALRVPVEQSNDSMNAQSHAQQVVYRDFKKTFGSDEILLLAVSREDLLTPEGLGMIRDLTVSIGEIDHVQRVLSLSNAQQLNHTDIGAEAVPLLPEDWTRADLNSQVVEAIQRNPFLSRILLSADYQTSALAIQIVDRPDDDDYRGAILAEIHKLTAGYRSQAVFQLTGLTAQKLAVARLIRRDQRVLMPLVCLALAGVLAFFFRRPLGVLLPLAVTGVSVIWTLGLYALLGYRLNTVTALLAPTLMVLSVAAGVHLYHGWLTMWSPGKDRVEVILRVVHELAAPCFFTALTTAIGLVSLTVSQTPAVRHFAIFAAVGVFLSFAAGITLIPVCLALLPCPKHVEPFQARGLLYRFLDFSARVATQRRAMVLGLAAMLTIVALLGIPRIRNNTNLIHFLKSSEPLFQATMAVDEKLTGSNSLEFLIQRRDGKPMTDLEDLRRLAAFGAFAESQAAVTEVVSLAHVIGHLHRAEYNTGSLELPVSQVSLDTCFALLEHADRELKAMLVTPDFKRTRASLRVRAIGTDEAEPLVKRLLQYGEELFGPDYDLIPTGNFYFVVVESNRIVRSQVRSFALAVTLAVLAIGILFRSLKLMFLAIIPNVMPIIWTAGLMGYSGISLSTGTAMIASVAIGLAVDDTIYYLARFRRDWRGDPIADVQRTTRSTGMALTIASLSLVVGFWAGCFGSFKPTLYFSVLTGITMASALLCDLWVLPACLTLAYRKTEPQSK